MKRGLPFLGIALGAALIGHALFFSKTEEERVRLRLDELATSVGWKGTSESASLRGARLRKVFGLLFSKDVALAIPELGAVEQGRAALVELALATPEEFTSLEVDLGALRIHLDESKEHALAVGDAHLTGERRSGPRSTDDRAISIRLDRIEGEWIIVNIATARAQKDRAEKSGVAPLKEPN